MIEIRNNKGELAELYPNASISIERNNPLFNDNNDFFEDITYSFKMPDTESNKIFFNSGHLIEASNKVYKIPVHCVFSGSPFFAGSIRYSFVDNDFDAVLLVNFAEIADQVKKVDMHDLYTADALPTFFTAAYMKDTCVNPQNYPYAFFPVYNENWNVGQLGRDTEVKTVNTWDHAAQTFIMAPYLARAITPYVKLKYMLQKTFEYLGFNVAGTYFDDLETDHVYIYTRSASKGYFLGTNTIFSRGFKIADFLKLVRNRFKIAFTFDVLSGFVRAEAAQSILSTKNVINISDYVGAIKEIKIPEQEGFTIVLKPDDQDELFLEATPSSDNKKEYIPTNRLVIGKGSDKIIELEGSTLKSKKIDDYSMPTTKQSIFLTFREEKLPIRFLKFSGMKPVAGGKVFPEALPLELTESDGLWNRFLNDSKSVSILAYLPINVLSDLQSTSKIAFVSNQGFNSFAIIEKIEFNIGATDKELVVVNLQVRTIALDIETPVLIEPVLPVIDTEINTLSFKAYFNTTETNFEKVEFELFNPTNSSSSGVQTILVSTAKNGANGSIVFPSFLTETNRLTLQNFELRISQGEPKYLIIKGQKLFFTARDGYWFVKYNEPFANWGVNDGVPAWIVF